MSMPEKATTPNVPSVPVPWGEVTCGHCPLWERFPWDEKCEGCEKVHASNKGLCRMDQPTIGPDGERGIWPTIYIDDWCAPGREVVMQYQEEMAGITKEPPEEE